MVGAALGRGRLGDRGARLLAEGLAAVRVLDGELGDGAQLAADPPGEDLTTLFLVEPAAREVALVDERDDVDDDLVLVEDGVDNDGDERREVRLARDLDEDDDETAGLEDSARNHVRSSFDVRR